MKRIYLLMIVFVALAGNVFAQRSVDMRVLHYFVVGGTPVIMKPGDKIFANATGNPGDHPDYEFRWIYKCLGPDTLIATDTIYTKTGLGTTLKGNLATVNGVGLNDSVWLTSTKGPLVPGSNITSSGTQTINWCDSMWVRDNTNAIVSDPVMPNNKHCTSIAATFWLTGVEEALIMANEVGLYPNPATNRLMLKYNFTTLTKNVAVTITDATGRIVSTQQFNGNYSGTNNIPLNITQLGSGLYFLRLSTDNGDAASSKFMIQ